MGNEDYVGWGVREGFLEELAWSTMVDNPGGKDSKGQGLLVGKLGRFEGQKRPVWLEQ